MNVLSLNNVTYTYEGAKKPVLKGVTASFESGKAYAIVGKSGSGKSTLLSLIAGLDVCADGTILYNDQDLKAIDRDAYRARSIGVVFQSYNLILNATALENIVLSMNISGSREPDKNAFALDLLRKVGIDEETARRKILRLSGGEQQRIGIARALAHSPSVIIADEPTGNLDGDTESDVLEIFRRLAHEEGRCVILVTHSRRVSACADEIWGIVDGKMLPVKTGGAGKE